MPKPSFNISPYSLVYGKEAIIPPSIYFPAFQLSQESRDNPWLLVQSRIDTLHKLQEERQKEKKVFLHQSCIKRWFDKNYMGKHKFGLGDLVLRWDKAHKDKGKHTKFQSLWIGPYTIHEKLGQHTYHLQSLDEKIDSLTFNVQDLKHYFQWWSRVVPFPMYIFSFLVYWYGLVFSFSM